MRSPTMPPMRTLLIALVLLGCSGDDKKTTVDAAVDAPAVKLDCDTYCTQIMANCTGANTQYASMGHCLGSCAAIPVGTSKVTDTSGNTLGCRIYHSGTPAMGMPGTHCPHAGPGGDLLTAAAPGGCSGGNICQNFCNIEIKTCGSIDAPIAGGVIVPQYQNAADCMTKCAAFPNKDQPYSTTAKGDSLACRLYHVTNAAAATVLSPPNAAMVAAHCVHSGPNGGANQAQCMTGTLP